MIQLKSDNGRTFYVNIDKIISIEPPTKDDDLLRVYFESSEGDWYNIDETVDDVLIKIKNARNERRQTKGAKND